MPICKKIILLENVTIEVKFFSKISLQFWNSFRFSVLTANYHLNEPKVSTHKTYMYSKKNLMCSVKKKFENSNFFSFLLMLFVSLCLWRNCILDSLIKCMRFWRELFVIPMFNDKLSKCLIWCSEKGDCMCNGNQAILLDNAVLFIIVHM